MKSVIQKILLGSSLLISYLMFGAIFKGNHKWMILFTLIASFFISYILLKRTHRGSNYLSQFLVLVLPIVLIFTVLSFVIGFTRPIFYIFFIPLSAFLGYLYVRSKKIVIPVLSVVLFSSISFIFFPNFIVYMDNKGARINKPFKSLTLLNKNRDTVRLNYSNVIALDFWTTSCGVCFEKFPDLERHYINFRNNQNVEVYSINVPLRGDEFDKTVRMVDGFGYEFPTLYAASPEEIENLGIHSYPHLLILKNGRIRYDGRLEVGREIFVNNIKDEIDRLIWE